MDSKGIFEALQAKFGEDVVFGYDPPKKANLDDYFFVTPDRWEEVAKYLRDDPKLDFDYLECLSGVDYLTAPVAKPASEQSKDTEDAEKGTVHVVYHLRSYDKKHRAVVKVSLPRDDASVTTVSNVWSSANWQERECFDLCGVKFAGHPDLRRIMLPDDWEGYPLRKDYKEKDSYHGIPTTRPNPFDLLVLKKPAPKKPEAQKAAPAPKKPDEKKPKAKKPDEEKPSEREADARPVEDKAEDKPADDTKKD